MDDEYRVKHIPKNFENMINLFGMPFHPIFLLEGIILLVSSFIGIFLLLRNCFNVLDIGRLIGLSFSISLIFFFIGIKGINDEPITTFLLNFISFMKRRRVAFYNPSLKESFSHIEGENENKLPYKKLFSYIEEKKDVRIKSLGNNLSKDVDFDPNIMEFEENIKINNEKKERHTKKDSSVNTK